MSGVMNIIFYPYKYLFNLYFTGVFQGCQLPPPVTTPITYNAELEYVCLLEGRGTWKIHPESNEWLTVWRDRRLL